MKTAEVLAHPVFRDLDRHFARLMERITGTENPALALAAALASHRRGDGDICVDLTALAGKPFPTEPAAENPPLLCPELCEWLDRLRQSPVVGAPGEFKPLILDPKSRLYLHRYWEYETALAADLQVRVKGQPSRINESNLADGLQRLFPSAEPGQIDWQKVAVFAALKRPFCIISGGPGTGKTRTVVLLLALLLEQAAGQKLHIALAAPTGKAASRLQESIRRTRETLPCAAEIKAALPTEASTIHRLLGTMPNYAGFRHNADNPLAVDVLVVDEASMVDLALMARLFQATPPSAKIILLGDKDQLASVEAGAVLGDLCQSAPPNSFSAAFRSEYHRVVGEILPPVPTHTAPGLLADCVVQLQKHYRFAGTGGIGALSRALNDGNADQALQLLGASSEPAVRSSPLPSAGALKAALKEIVLEAFGAAGQLRDPLAALQHQTRFRVLGALRQGPYGIDRLNHLIEQILLEAKVIDRTGPVYPGRPIMITRNDYQLNLFNGDLGVILPDAQTGELHAFFAGPDEVVRKISPLRLPDHETVYAMSVHKSQGSEFRRVLLILPDRDLPLLTRELVYTGVTRASHEVELWFDEPVFRAALARRVERTSGLRDALSATTG